MIPDDARMVVGVPPERRLEEGIPNPVRAEARRRAAGAVEELLADVLHHDGLRVSPLGPGWSTDIDAHVRTLPDPSRLLDEGWLPLDPLLRRLGRRTTGRWAVRDGNHVLAALDLHPDPPPEPLAGLEGRVRRLGTVRLREVLELRTLQRTGIPIDTLSPAIIGAIADREATLGGDQLARWRTGERPAGHEATRNWFARARTTARRVHRVTRPRLVVSISGVDGAGKSTLATHLMDELELAGVPCSRIWCRPGMGTIEFIAAAGKRLLGRTAEEAGVRRVARGDDVAPTSRRGVIGWLWTSTVLITYLLDVWRAHLGAHGVVIYDRHELDALATLGVAYRVTTQHERLVSRLLPHADHRYYLEIDADLAVARKQDEVFGPAAVQQQLLLYERLLHRVSAVRLNAVQEPRVNATEIIHDLISVDIRS